jgi:hypothetical protein
MSEENGNVEVNAAFGENQVDAAQELATENTLKDAMTEKSSSEGNVDKAQDDQFASRFAALSRKAQ